MKHPSSTQALPASPTGWALYVAEAGGGHAPAGPRRPLAFTSWLFLEPTHQALQAVAGPVLGFFLEDPAANLTVAQLYVALDYPGPGQAASPAQAPFGGVQLAPGLPAEALHPLLAAAEATLRQRGQRQLHLRPPAACYDPAGTATLAAVLQQRGYQPLPPETNYHLDPARDYEAHLHPSERRRLRRSRRLGLVPEQEPAYLLPLAYEFIARCRQERGYDLSLSLARVEALFRMFPQQHLLFSVRKPGGEWAALTVAVQASAGVLYNFYPASPLTENRLSPTVLLGAGLHAHARASGLTAVDLGTSTLPTGQPNEPLLRFKRQLGGMAGEKVTWQLSLEGGIVPAVE